MQNFKHNFVKMKGALLNKDAKFDYGSIMMYPPNMGTLPTELRSWVKKKDRGYIMYYKLYKRYHRI